MSWWTVGLDALVALVPLQVLGWYLSVSAGRLDRLHHRVESSRAGLEAQLVRRAVAAMEAAPWLDPARGLLLADAASAALEAGEDRGREPGPRLLGGQDDERLVEVENDLTAALRVAFGEPEEVRELQRDPVAGQVLAVLRRACERVALARLFLNDAVAQAHRRRRKPVVRWARLAGRAPLPQMVEFDDGVPAGLAGPS